MSELTKYEVHSLDKLYDSINNGKWSNNGLVQLIELAGNFLNLTTIPHYAKTKGLSYNGVKKTRTIVRLFGCKFVIEIDND